MPMETNGKLAHVAELLFCLAYGLNGYGKIHHAICIPFWMSHYNCSFCAIASLLYGTSYKQTLSKWRACVANYFTTPIDLKTLSLLNLPAVSNFDAHSVLQYKTANNIAVSTTDFDPAMQRVLRHSRLPFYKLVLKTTDGMQYQLSTIFRVLNFHQRVALALQIAHCFDDIWTWRDFRSCGRFVLHNDQARIGQPSIARGTSTSPCATVTGAVFGSCTALSSKHVCNYLYSRLNLLKHKSFNPNILDPFVKYASILRARVLNNDRARLIATNLTPPNIFVTFDGSVFSFNFFF